MVTENPNFRQLDMTAHFNLFKNNQNSDLYKCIDSFSFPKSASETQQYKQLGNSVSISVIEELAKYMYHHLEEFKHYGVQ